MPSLDPQPEALPGSGRIVVAFSGGPDSLCLLHLLTRSGTTRPLKAIHIDHRLDGDSGRRARRATELAAGLEVDCEVIEVAIKPGASTEAAAREARYRALAGRLTDGDVVVTAHHADDQIETVFLRLLRGAGPHGLAGMPRRRRLGEAWLARPMLDWSREDVQRYLQTHGLNAIEDPANLDFTHDRNYLRHTVLPALRDRWPGMRRSVLESARLQRHAAEALDELAAIDLAHCLNPGGRVDATALAGLSGYRQGLLIRHWCRQQQIAPPPGRRLMEFIEQIAGAGRDRIPELRWSGGVLRSWDDRLWLETHRLPPSDWRLPWPDGPDLELPDSLGRLQLEGTRQGLPGVVVMSGRDGERIRLPGRSGHRAVSQLMAERRIPPWQRMLWPRLWRDEELLGVGDQWLSPALTETLDELNARLKWETPLETSARTGEPGCVR